MKTSILRAAIIAAVVLSTSGFTAEAQEPFYDTTWKNGRIETRTQYVAGYSGLYERNLLSEYTYDEAENFVMKDVFVWKKKYVWNDKKELWLPDYSRNNWRADYRIVQRIDEVNTLIIQEYFVWNDRKKEYGEPMEKMIYQLDNSNRFNYLAYQKGDKYTEWVNNLLDKELLAEFFKNIENKLIGAD
jgi:hypothetical protein